MGKLEIIREGAMTSIQDLGREGWAYYAIPRSGAMDTRSSRIGLLLLGRKETEPVIECTMTAPHLKFKSNTKIVLTGADFQWTINDISVARNTILEIHEGDELKGGRSMDGMRGYISLDGRIHAEIDFDSASTYGNARLGGKEGRFLKKGDNIEWEGPVVYDHKHSFVFHPGPEYDYLSKDSKTKLFDHPFVIGSDSNRMGLRLNGNTLNISSFELIDSIPVLPGFIQLPPNGDPILLLNDGQTTGGYPRIGYISEEDLPRIGQVMLGEEIWLRRSLSCSQH